MGEQQSKPARQDEGGNIGDDYFTHTANHPSILCDIDFLVYEAITSTHWTSEEIEIDPTTTPKELEDRIRSMLIDKLENDGKVWECCIEKASSCNTHTFDSLGDLFTDHSVHAQELLVDVDVIAVRRPAKNEEVKIQKFHIAKEGDLEPADAVFGITSLEQPQCPVSFVRLGKVPYGRPVKMATQRNKGFIPDSNSSEFVSRARDAGAKLNGVPMPELLLGWYFDGYLSKDKHLNFQATEAWDFEEFCIGNLMTGRDVTYVQSKWLMGEYKGAKTQRELVKRAAQHVNSEAPETGSGIPFMPSYSDNIFSPTEFDLGVPGPGRIYIVVRFVDDVGIEHNGRENAFSPLWLPCNVQLDFDVNSTARDIGKQIGQELENHGNNDRRGDAEKHAFTRFWRRDDWDLCYWVLPQESRKMYKFPTQLAGDDGCLSQFLSPRMAKRGGKFARTLYMEVHIKLKPQFLIDADSEYQDRIRRQEEEEEEEVALREAGEYEEYESESGEEESDGQSKEVVMFTAQKL